MGEPSRKIREMEWCGCRVEVVDEVVLLLASAEAVGAGAAVPATSTESCPRENVGERGDCGTDETFERRCRAGVS
jgi:hypothetical protein